MWQGTRISEGRSCLRAVKRRMDNGCRKKKMGFSLERTHGAEDTGQMPSGITTFRGDWQEYGG